MLLSDRDILIKIKTTKNNPDLIKDMEGILWGRYQNQIHKHWHIFLRMLNYSPVAYSWEEEYYSGVYEEAFCYALRWIKLSKIKDNNWKFVGPFNLFLTNHRNGMIQKALNQHKHEISMYAPSKDGDDSPVNLIDNSGIRGKSVEEDFLEKETASRMERGIEFIKSLLSDQQKKVLELKLADVNTYQISIQLQIPYSRVDKELKVIREALEEFLKFN